MERLQGRCGCPVNSVGRRDANKCMKESRSEAWSPRSHCVVGSNFTLSAFLPSEMNLRHQRHACFVLFNIIFQWTGSVRGVKSLAFA